MLRAGRVIFGWVAGGLTLLVLGTMRRLPEVVASHFDAAGMPNGWSSRLGYAALVLVIGVLLPLGVIGLVHAATARGPSGLNIPSREYWLEPAHREQAVELVRAYIWWLGIVLAATALAVHVAILRANATAQPRLSGWLIAPLIIGIAAAIGAWAAGWYRVLRPPGQDRGAA